MKSDIVGLARRIVRAVTHDAGFKLLAVVCAVLLWSYVAVSNPDTIREKSFDNMEIAVVGATAFENRGLALTDDLSATLPPVRVQIDVPQGNYNRATSDNISVELDLSRISQPGVTTVRLRARSSYGTVTQIIPAEFDVTVDDRAQRNVPINVSTVGDIRGDFFYDATRNPYQVTISGPATLVNQVASALVEIDVTGLPDGRQERVEGYRLLDAAGEEIISPVITRSTAVVSVRLNALPKLNMRINSDADRATSGTPLKNYQVTSVEIEPETVDVAAEATLLETLAGSELYIEPINVEGLSETQTRTARVRVLSGIQNISAPEVNVTVHIAEERRDRLFKSVPVTVINTEGRAAKLGRDRVNVMVTGPVTAVSALVKGDIEATIDLRDIPPGVELLPVLLKVINQPELEFEAEPAEITATITEK